jgi:DUF1680 family protein
MERAVYNALFAAQSPDGRRIRYYTPFESPRVYFPKDSYCCPNNYRRIIAELPELIYYRAGDGLAVNLYTASEARVELAEGLGVEVRQQTDYPSSGRVAIHVDPSRPAEFAVALRIPRWCSGAAVTLGGAPVGEPVRGGQFFKVRRQWQPGDRLDVQMPMPWRLVKGRKAQAGRVAVMRGPLLFCLSLQRNPALTDLDLRSLTLDPASLRGPVAHETVRPGGIACRARAWSPGRWYPHAPPDLELLLSEFADPGGVATYFHVPNPEAEELVADELCAPCKNQR